MLLDPSALEAALNAQRNAAAAREAALPRTGPGALLLSPQSAPGVESQPASGVESASAAVVAMREITGARGGDGDGSGGGGGSGGPVGEIDVADEHGYSPLMKAAAVETEVGAELVKLLVDAGSSLEVAQGDVGRPLFMA